MATKNLANYNWEDYDDELYDEFIEEESSRKIKIKNKDRDNFSHKGKKSKVSRKSTEPTEEIYYGLDNNEYESPFSDLLKDYNIDNSQNKEVSKPQPKESPVVTPPPAKKPVEITGEYVKEIKNIKIDFSRLVNIQQVEGEYQGHQTFGIKFYFKGNKGLFRIIWYGRNVFERDHAFTENYEYWRQIENGR